MRRLFLSLCFIFLHSICFAQNSAQDKNQFVNKNINLQSKNLMHEISKNSADIELNLDVSKYPKDINFWSNYPNPELAYVIAKRMTDEELLAQILMFGWAGA